MASIPHANGKDSTIQLFTDGSPTKEFDASKWDITRECEEIADGVCGEDRDRLDSITNYFTVTVSCFVTTGEQLDSLIADQTNDDAGFSPLSKSVALILRPRNGGKSGYLLKEVSVGKWKIGAGGRKDRVMIDYPMRCRYVDKAAL